MKKFEKPEFKIAQYDTQTNVGTFAIEPLERGFGLTLGNALRRVLLSSLPGASIFACEVEGARHEFSSLDGINKSPKVNFKLSGIISPTGVNIS